MSHDVDAMALNRCEDEPPVVELTTPAPVGAHHMLFMGNGNRLYAINASDGTRRWCQQVHRIIERALPPTSSDGSPPQRHMSMPPPRQLHFSMPRVVNGKVFVCVSGAGRYTCALKAETGELIWRTPTDAWRVDMPFGDYAIPVIKDGVVYNGSYALHEQDGTVLRRMAVDPRWFTSQAVMDDMLYGIGQMGVQAVDIHTGEVTWFYRPEEEHTMISGPLVAADRLIYVGTSGPEYHPPKVRFFALDAKTGAEVWRYPTGSYVAARVRDDTVYVSAGDTFLYALDALSGTLRWQYQFDAHGGYWPAVTKSAVYMATDGIYAFNRVTGTLLWRQHPGDSYSGSFTPPVVLEEVVYLIRIGKRGQSALNALSANDETEYWHRPVPTQYAPFSVAE